MSRHTLLLAAALAAGGAAFPLVAQKAPPPATRPQTQPPTPARAPATSGKVFRPAASPAQPAAPAATSGASGAPSVQGGAEVTPQATRPTSPAAPSAAATFTAGLAMPPFGGGGPSAALEYAARLGRTLDSAIVTLVDVFRNSSGQPMSGASSPTALSERERDRWLRCRNLYWDLTTHAAAVGALKQALPADAALQRALAALDSAFTANRALAECDNVASMIAAPERWTPWQSQYESAARHLYRDFYDQVRDVHERDRAFVNALNAVLPPAQRIPVPPGLPRNPPYAGASPS